MTARAPLELDPEVMRRLGHAVIDMLVDHAAGQRARPVTGHAARETLEALLREPLPEGPTRFETVLEQLKRDVLPYNMEVPHPRFFGFIPSPSNFVSVLGDALAAGVNAFAGIWLEGSGAAQVELVTVDWLRAMCGLPPSAGGLFVSGGSMANLTALAAARHVRLGEAFGDAVVYCSDQTHASVDRALRVLGFRGDQLRRLPSDAEHRLDVSQLDAAAATDRGAGRRPFCVVANAGTTNSGAIDPLETLADFCRREGLWLHVDGAYGAAAMLTETGRGRLRGLERADSVSLDPHKWLFQPYEIGCVLVRDASDLHACYRLMPEYLQDTAAGAREVNFADCGVQLTRSFRALKLWLSFKTFGAAAFRDAIAAGIARAEYAAALLHEAPAWEVSTPASLGIVTFRYAAGDDAFQTRLVHALIDDGFAMVSSTRLGGRTVLRMCTINPRSTDDDVRATLDRLAALAEGLGGG